MEMVLFWSLLLLPLFMVNWGERKRDVKFMLCHVKNANALPFILYHRVIARIYRPIFFTI